MDDPRLSFKSAQVIHPFMGLVLQPQGGWGWGSGSIMHCVGCASETSTIRFKQLVAAGSLFTMRSL